MKGDGTCALDIDQTQKGSIINDVATGSQISAAAWDLIQECFSIQANDRGGIATGLGKSKYQRTIENSTSNLILVGKEGRLSLVVQKYTPNVQCGDPSFSVTGGLLEACQTAVNILPVSTFPQKFGAVGTPGAEIELPKSYADGEKILHEHKHVPSVYHLAQ